MATARDTLTLDDLDRQLLALLPDKDPSRYAIQECIRVNRIRDLLTGEAAEASSGKITGRLKKLDAFGVASYQAPYSVRPDGWHLTGMGVRIRDKAAQRALLTITRKDDGGVRMTFAAAERAS